MLLLGQIDFARQDPPVRAPDNADAERWLASPGGSLMLAGPQ
jgi:hypothetical protein